MGTDHVCLVSGQALPNLIPLLDPGFQANRAILVVSNPEMSKKANALAQALKNRGRHVTIEALGNDSDFTSMRSTFENLSAKYPHAALNATGGKKTMTLAAYEAFNQGAHDIFYVEQNNMIRWLRGSGSNILADCLSLNDILEAHGFTLQRPEGTENPAYLSLATSLFNKRDKSLMVLPFLITTRKDMESLHITFENREFLNEAHDILAPLENNSLIHKEKNNEWVAQNQTVRFLKGEWLEIYVHGCVERIAHQFHLHDIYHGVVFKIASAHEEDEKNEFDVTFVCHNQLYLIECKVIASKKSSAAINPFIYKIDSITPRFGGLTVHAALILLGSEVTEPMQKKANLRRIKIFSRNDMNDLELRLGQWIAQEGN